MIPQDKTDAVVRGLREAFQTSEIEDISAVTGGHTSSLVFRIVVGGAPYLLKIITRGEDQSRHYAVMRGATEAGVAPRVLCTSVEDKISITDFVEAAPVGRTAAVRLIPALLRKLHAAAPFATAPFNTSCTFLLNPSPMLEGWLARFRDSALLPNDALGEFFSIYEEIKAVYPQDGSEFASCHNDVFKPDNFLFDGTQLWLVDWEAAFWNDRYADLAVAANHVVTSEDDETLYLREYFGEPPTEYQLARFHAMQQLADLFYTTAFLLLGSAGKPIDWSQPVPEFEEFYRRMWMREVDLTEPEVKVMHGRVHWNRLLRNVRVPRYREALKVLAGRSTVPYRDGTARD